MESSFFVLLCFALLTLIQLLFYWGLLSKRPQSFGHKSEKDKHFPPVSVIICARNEAENLKNHLPFFFNQKYPEFEIIVINDRSTDQSGEILAAMSDEYPQLRIVENSEDDPRFPGKRKALSLGIASAHHQHLLLCDADCYPASKYWIRRMMEYGRNSSLCLGYGDYKRGPGLLNSVIRYDTFQIASFYYAFASAGMLYMGVGRNILYDKSLLQKYLEHSVVPGIESGDDDLLINSLPMNMNVALAYSFNSRTISIPASNWSTYIRQKSRHLSTPEYYRRPIAILLGAYHGMSLVFWMLFCVLLFTDYWYLALILFILRYLFVYWTSSRRMSPFIKGLRLFLFPFFELIIYLVQCVAWTSRILNYRNDWR